MKNETTEVVSIYILNKEYQIRCPHNKIKELQETALYLEQKIKEAEKHGIRNNERLAIAAALNACHDLLQIKHDGDYLSDNLAKKLHSLEQKISAALSPNS